MEWNLNPHPLQVSGRSLTLTRDSNEGVEAEVRTLLRDQFQKSFATSRTPVGLAVNVHEAFASCRLAMDFCWELVWIIKYARGLAVEFVQPENKSGQLVCTISSWLNDEGHGFRVELTAWFLDSE